MADLNQRRLSMGLSRAAFGLYGLGVRSLGPVTGVRPREMTIDGRQVAYLDSKGLGRLPPIVMLHGLLGDATHFAQVTSLLRPFSRRQIAVDLPGHGRSDPPSGEEAIPSIQATLSGFIEQVGEPVVLVGHSLGATLALELAGLRPDLFRAVVALEPAGGELSTDELKEVFERLDLKTEERAQAFVDLCFQNHGLAYFLAKGSAGDLVRRFGQVITQQLIFELAARGKLETELLERITTPTLVVRGGADRLLPAEGLDSFERLRNRSLQTTTQPDWGHAPLFQQPSEVATIIRQFATQHALPDTVVDSFHPGNMLRRRRGTIHRMTTQP